MKSVKDPANIFLTGATGFLGTFLLYELLEQTSATIYCLVRAASPQAGNQRLQDTLKRYALWDEGKRNRIVPVQGDLSVPLLGLSPSQFESWAEILDVIYHNGGLVNFLYPYSVLKAPNVQGTHEILRLACQAKVKPVHFISTVGVFSPIAYQDRPLIREEDPLDRTEGLYGYTQSKWVAEKMIEAARERGLPATIHRPFWIEGHSQTGACNQADFLRSAISGCIQLGLAPDWQMRVDIVPVDYLSRAIVYLSRQESSIDKTFHFSNPKALSWTQLVKWMQNFGYPLQQLPARNWLSKMIDQVQGSPDNALYPFLPFFSEQIPGQQMSIPDTYFQTKPLQFDCQNTISGLASTDITCPPVDDNLLETYFSYFIKTGFLHPPKAKHKLRSRLAVG
ncbi:MAG: thioester reductase domain-containing protein [Cyanobacteria bacterium SID2]|nr:thioester reductase domain-containing protein [Cyanobacteria bacterium SID2]MBP0003914.1 thioester reductase domain-containing protein [Cyanobacteria bacterium SBC]